MQALGRKDQRRVTLRIGLPALAFVARFSDALAGAPELEHQARLFILGERSGNLPHHDPRGVCRFR
jgi:hypothetical protein